MCVLDGGGRIVETNHAWRAFAEDNGGVAGLTGAGMSYLDQCEPDSPIARGIRDVLEGRSASFEACYPCHAPDQERWFVVSASRRDDEHEGVFIEHVDVTARQLAERRAGLLSNEHASLRRVATAVAREEPAEAIFALVASETATVCGAAAAGVTRIADGAWEVVGTHAPAGSPVVVGLRAPLRAGGELETVLRTAAPIHIPDYAPGHPSPVAAIGYRSFIAAPVLLGNAVWGVVTLGDPAPRAFSDDHVELLTDFAELVAVCVQTAASRAALVRAAQHDALTDVLNHRSFLRRLGEQLADGERWTVARIDLDHFKSLNDAAGHGAGDEVLVVCADVLRGLFGADAVGRLGGDEFGVMCDVDPEALTVLLELAHAEIETRLQAPLAFSAGISDTVHTRDPARLLALAHTALHWSKRHGRGRTCLYDPDVVVADADEQLAEVLKRELVLQSIRALALAIDAKDPSTREHSERVATLACRLAGRLGWSDERVGRLREAALVHDVGKIGVPDAVLLKPGRLTADEYEQVKEHAALGASIVANVLTEEQVRWIRGHHERPDGRGYPDGLRGDEVPDGSRIIAVADSFDVMTSVRPYSAPMSVAEAVAECRALAGSQFDEDVVGALVAVASDGGLGVGSGLVAVA